MSAPQTFTTSHTPGEKTGTTTFYVGHGRTGEWLLTGISFVPQQAITADGSHKFVIAMTDGSDTVATSYDTSATAFVAGTGAQATMSAAGTDLEFGPTDSVKFVCTKSGTATLEAEFLCHWRQARV
jgi:hypothetical protein